ncbi:preprotein translocase subunit SecE [Mycolicibacterium diernhoferi]|uniref:Protein translocase subunit SecE n=1 Tax=Mycolicibacterium diernhoferi TaxID=1801 RepID=A0A1Q4HC11_9MYCO|nr:preprotein translocase subunit SecE [Mycolicibacterium diernhoferi]OPE53340.1 preprotein translocase subunit SecE [Mycolicibacterium diernhoferi]PEG52258.1 preprotein translocase subunit SecE [Mycolicibacterium diernhoferi]QYL23728.1 preprotein translocase subunit SecE [Mycolicibacterium diernhoferi]
MSDDQPPLGPSAGEGPVDGGTSGSAGAPAGPLRPSGKRSRRTAAEPAGGAVAVSESDDADDAGADEKPAKRTKTAKAAKSTDGARLNPFAFVWNYLKQVVGELRKVIWPNRKQMVTYTTVVLVFLAFMVAMIGGVDLGLAKLVSLIFG